MPMNCNRLILDNFPGSTFSFSGLQVVFTTRKLTLNVAKVVRDAQYLGGIWKDKLYPGSPGLTIKNNSNPNFG